MKKRIRKWIIVLSTLVMLLSISACGKEEQPLPEVTPEPLADWKTKGFQVGEEVEVGQLLGAGNYQPWEHGGAGDDISHLSSGVCDNTFWFFGTILGEDGKLVPGPAGQYFVECYDAAQNSYSSVQFTPAQLGLSGEIGLLVDMDMLSTGKYMFRWAEYTLEEENYRQVADILIFTNLAGENQQVDFYEVFAEAKVESYRETYLPLLPSTKLHMDKQGHIWFTQVNPGVEQFCLFDKECNLLMEYKGQENQNFMAPFYTYDGEMILPIYSEQQKHYEFFWVNVAEKEFVSVGKMKAPVPDITKFYGMSENNIFYRARNPQNYRGECIVEWNIGSGKRTMIYEFVVDGIGGYDTMLACNASNQLMLRLMKYGVNSFRDWVVPLTMQGEQETSAIQVVDFYGGADILKTAAAQASMETPDKQYHYKELSSDEERTRILAEMTQGKGPDIMFVPVWDFYMMVEKGMLLDMDALISEKLREEVWPAVLQMGKEGDALFGVPAEVYAETFAVSNSLETQKQWGLEEIGLLMEQGKLSGAIRSPYMGSDYATPIFTIQTILYDNLQDSFLIDWQKRESHFEDERFVRLLELTRQDMSKQEAEGLEDTDLIWAYLGFESDVEDFFLMVEKADLQMIGYPGNNGESFLCADGGMVVVNAACTDLEAVKFFLEILWSEEIQARRDPMSLSVRKLMPEEGNEDMIAFLNDCVPSPRRVYDINTIINQEITAMYAEGKSAEETARVIDNRVQVYLDEKE